MRRNRAGILVVAGALVLLGTACAGGGERDADGWIAYRSPSRSRSCDPTAATTTRRSPIGPPDARHPDWSRDGTRIVFQAEDPADHITDLWIAPSDGTNPKLLIDCKGACGGTGDPAWSPDSKRVAFSAFTAGKENVIENQLRIVDVSTRKVTTVVRSPGAQGISAPRWSPDGHRLVVSVTRWVTPRLDDDRIRGNAIAIVDLDAAHPSLRMITRFDSYSDHPDWHPSKDLIVFVAGAVDPYRFMGRPANLFTIRPDGTELTRLTSRGTAHPWIASPAWSPDGSELLVTLVHGLGSHTLATVEPDGTDLADIIDSATGKPVRGAHSRQAPESAG